MSDINELPLNLYKANLELQVKIGKLIQEGGQQWLDFVYRLYGDGIAESNAEVEELLRTQDWQKLATLPAEAFWRQLQQRFGDSQAMAQIAVSAQTAFASGLQEAVRTWQKETAQALGGSALTAPLNESAWAELFKPWQQLLAAVAPGAGEPAAKAPGTKPAAGARGGGRHG